MEQVFQKPVVADLHPVGGLEFHWYRIEVGTTVTHWSDERGLHVLVDRNGIVRDVALADTSDQRK